MMLPETTSIVVSISMALGAGILGCFALMRRMTLAADAMSHLALPGIGIALMLRISPLAGAFVALLLGAALIWSIERRSGITTETVVCVVFSVSLALGVVLSSREVLIDTLVGRTGAATLWESALGV